MTAEILDDGELVGAYQNDPAFRQICQAAASAFGDPGSDAAKVFEYLLAVYGGDTFDADPVSMGYRVGCRRTLLHIEKMVYLHRDRAAHLAVDLPGDEIDDE